MIAIVDYGAGNVFSVQCALERLGANSVLTKDPEVLLKAEKVLFPGVGHAKAAMEALKENGLDQVLGELSVPILGICLGMQLMCLRTQEGDTQGLGIFPVEVRNFPSGLPVPHMGWNSLEALSGPLFKGIAKETDFYFVHSFYAEPSPYTTATTEYNELFSAALEKDNYFAVQFHPEKSGAEGEKLLQNFLKL